jgi:Macrocin-O-methyltransferase (TylF)
MREVLALLRGSQRPNFVYNPEAKESHNRQLPDVGVPPGVRKGRVPRDGYQRGLLLQLAALGDFVRSERLYNFAAQEGARLHALISEEKRINLYLILTRFLPKLPVQNIVEFGCFRGGTALFMALVLREVAPGATVYALDTFEGMPPVDGTIDTHRQGDFVETTIQGFRDRIEACGLTNIVPVKGLFEETFPKLPENLKFGLAHIDADIYSAIKYAQDAVWPCMTEGGYVVYDDADISSCLGATEAVEDLIQEKRVHCEQIWPHFVFRANL